MIDSQESELQKRAETLESALKRKQTDVDQKDLIVENKLKELEQVRARYLAILVAYDLLNAAVHLAVLNHIGFWGREIQVWL